MRGTTSDASSIRPAIGINLTAMDGDVATGCWFII